MESKIKNFSFGYNIEFRRSGALQIKQVHGCEIVEFDRNNLTREADGIFTYEANQPVCVSTADCVPVLLASDKKVMAVHAGWRGVLHGIVRKAVASFEVPPTIWIGPHIGKCCFEVKEDFLADFRKKHANVSSYTEKWGGRTYFNLLGFILEEDLKGFRVEEVIYSDALCTYCATERLPSYRRNKMADPYLKTWIKRESQSSS